MSRAALHVRGPRRWLAGLTLVCALAACRASWSVPRAHDRAAAPGSRAAGERTTTTSTRSGRVVLLAIGGLDAERLEAALDGGHWPGLTALAARGTASRLLARGSSEEPALAAQLFSGRGPASNGIASFLRRSLAFGTPTPAFGSFDPHTWTPAELGRDDPNLPTAVAVLRSRFDGPFVWELAARGGASTTVVRGPLAEGRPDVEGLRLLHGAGNTDATGALGAWWLYSEDPAEGGAEDSAASGGRATPTAGTILPLRLHGGLARTALPGPTNVWLLDRLARRIDELERSLADPGLSDARSVSLAREKRELGETLARAREPLRAPLFVERSGARAVVTLDGASQSLAVGDWSQPFQVDFELMPELALATRTRIKLLALEPWVRLLVLRLDLDPAAEPPPWRSVSSPASFALELAASAGSFATYGWATATMPYKDEVVELATLVESAEQGLRTDTELVRAALAGDARLVIGCLDGLDHLRHMLGRVEDPGHPLHDPLEAERVVRFFGERIAARDVVERMERELDRFVGEVAASLAPDDSLLVVSTHGFESFRQGVDLNAWLTHNGYLALRAPVPSTKALGFVDWQATRAYSLGFGALWLNEAGREPAGQVAPRERGALLEELRAKLLAATDPATGARFVETVDMPRNWSGGPYADELPDLVVGFAAGYRAGWDATSGSIGLAADGGPGPVVRVNASRWSGCHESVASELVEGFVVSNRAFDFGDRPELRQVAPTLLTLLGIAVPASLELAPWPLRRAGHP